MRGKSSLSGSWECPKWELSQSSWPKDKTLISLIKDQSFEFKDSHGFLLAGSWSLLCSLAVCKQKHSLWCLVLVNFCIEWNGQILRSPTSICYVNKEFEPVLKFSFECSESLERMWRKGHLKIEHVSWARFYFKWINNLSPFKSILIP